MSKIKSIDTKPELVVKKFLNGVHAKFVMHPKDVLGKPDIVDRENKVAVFIDGCFWHGCKTCRTIPKANKKFWKTKIDYNKSRRTKVKKHLKKEGWRVMEFWEHDVNKNPKAVSSAIVEELGRKN